MSVPFAWLGFAMLSLGALGCGDDDVAVYAGPVCPAVGRPDDGTPCTLPGALCYYDESSHDLVFECSRGSCPDAPCNALLTECSARGFGHVDTGGCVPDDAGEEVDAARDDAAISDASVSEVCPAVGRPEDGTPCTLTGALCYYSAEGDGHLLFTCPSGDCPDAPCGLFTECEGNGGFHHWDGNGCDGSI